MASAFAQPLRRAVGVIAMMSVTSLASAIDYNLRQGVTEISNETFDLHMLIFWICVVIGAGVFSVMCYSLFAHRKSRGAESANFHHSTGVEIAWTVVPFVILIAMAIPAAKLLIKMEDTTNADLTVKVTGFQWGWHYEYLDNGVQHYSMLDEASNAARQKNSGIDVSTVPFYLRNVDKPLVLPTGKKVKFLITSLDVIHSWWVPDLGGKKDANPGAVNSMWARIDEAGRYDGKCTELCGKDHGYMPIVVEAVSPAEFDAYISQKQAEAGIEAPSVAAAQ